MPEVSQDIVTLLYYLLPGFLTAWVFYALTSHPRREPFERVAQALIFTVLVQAVVVLCRQKLAHGTKLYEMGLSGPDANLVWSVAVALVLGMLFATLANHDWLHWVLRKLRITTRTSYPSEWFSTLVRCNRYMVLTLKDGRRLYGWAYEWPDSCDRGHFVMMFPAWVSNSGNRMAMPLIDKLLIPATDVSWIEFEKPPEEHKLDPAAIAEAHKRLIELNKENKDGSKTTDTTP